MWLLQLLVHSLWMFVCLTVSADSFKWKSSFQPGVFDAHASIKALSADVLVSSVHFLNLEMCLLNYSISKTAKSSSVGDLKEKYINKNFLHLPRSPMHEIWNKGSSSSCKQVCQGFVLRF